MKDLLLEEDLISTAAKFANEKNFFGKTFLITGATGLVGSQLAKTLLMLNHLFNSNITVLAMVRDEAKAREIYEEFPDQELHFIIGDMLQPIEISQSVDYIVHTASPTASKFFVEHPVETLSIAIDGTRAILELARKKNCAGVVYLSSMEAFGITDPSLSQITETDLGYINIHNVRSSYSEGKRVCELLCTCYAAEYQVPVRIARLAQTFGAGVSYKENRVFAQFAKSVINGTDIVLHTTGQSVGNYCYTRDVVSAILLLLLKGEDGQAYTVANEASSIKICDMARLVAEKLANGKIQVQFDIPTDALVYGYAPDVQMHLSSQKLRNLGWKPEIGLMESYERLIASMKLTR